MCEKDDNCAFEIIFNNNNICFNIFIIIVIVIIITIINTRMVITRKVFLRKRMIMKFAVRCAMKLK